MSLTAEARDAWFLTGPTASGKTEIGVGLAELLNAEIVSLDSMAVYRGMEIGTAKPTPADCARIPHHLVDLLEPNHQYSLASYVEDAGRAVRDIAARGHQALFVGGTPLYLKALLRGIFQGPAADWQLRRQLQAELDRAGEGALHRRLQEVDAASAARLHPRDHRRVIRALEVWEKTGQSISRLQQQFEHARPAEACRVFVLNWPAEDLARRIDDRVERMFAAGFVDEVRELSRRYGELSRTASQALGYREVIEHLAGQRDLPATIELVKLRTRQFAKRQRTWFRSLSECRSVPMTEGFSAIEIARQIEAAARGV
ncbi:MAG TPA: tRNA (adenosine(37)-N6)-dimethylallyltransferase MiaA [Pirellulales bacterium]|jgi:tRNA dimethylallyltransferase|nr:tRNA (adenosine(37)-N6)-dimethylallyltransferase MiaA [Pirellulales bacterium]